MVDRVRKRHSPPSSSHHPSFTSLRNIDVPREVLSPPLPSSFLSHTLLTHCHVVLQIDLVPTLSSLFSLPLPSNNAGKIISSLSSIIDLSPDPPFSSFAWSHSFLHYQQMNVIQLLELLRVRDPESVHDYMERSHSSSHSPLPLTPSITSFSPPSPPSLPSHSLSILSLSPYAIDSPLSAHLPRNASRPLHPRLVIVSTSSILLMRWSPPPLPPRSSSCLCLSDFVVTRGTPSSCFILSSSKLVPLPPSWWSLSLPFLIGVSFVLSLSIPPFPKYSDLPPLYTLLTVSLSLPPPLSPSALTTFWKLSFSDFHCFSFF